MQEAPQSDMLSGLTGKGNLSPKQKQEIDSYITMMMDFVHNKKTSKSILDMLKSGQPEQTIPQTALRVNSMAEQMVQKETGSPPSSFAKIGASIYLVSDLIEVGNAAGLFNISDENQIKSIYKDTLQKYIHNGIKDGSIDPVELQQAAEPLLSEEQRNAGSEVGIKAGVSARPTNEMANNQLQKRSAMMGNE